MPHRRAGRSIRLVLVEPHALYGAGVREILERETDIEVVAEARTPDDAAAIVRSTEPDVIVVDIEPADAVAIDATLRLKRETPGSALVLVGHEDPEAGVLEALQVGAAARVQDDAEPAVLVDAIRRAAEGDEPIRDAVAANPDLAGKIMDAFREASRRHVDDSTPRPLTARELAVLGQVGRGLRNREIAEVYGLSEQTIKNSVSMILHKLGVPNRTRAVMHAVRQGWLALDTGAETPVAVAAADGGELREDTLVD